MKVAVAQINTTVGDLAGNCAKILTFAEKAERAAVDLVVFPELTITGYPLMDLVFKRDFTKAAHQALEGVVEWSRGHSLCLAVGGIEKPGPDERKVFNTLFFIKNGNILARQRKSLLPTYDVFIEEMFFKKGSDFPVIDLGGERVGGTVCEDIWDENYELKPLARLADQNAGIVVNASASPFHVGRARERQNLVCGQAQKYGITLIFANLVGGQDDLIFDGRSMVADQTGRLLARGASFTEALVVADTVSSGRAPEEVVSWEKAEAEMYSALSLGLSDYVRKNSFSRVVIGLSGGIDSALVATIAADALGAHNVVGVSMPGPYSSPGSFRDAQLLARNLGIEFRVRPIRSRYAVQRAEFRRSEICEHLRARNSALGRWTAFAVGLLPVRIFAAHGTSLASENLQARLRGEMLMYISNAESSLVLSTGNKSELAMGYCTLYGDMCGGLGVLADVYKTEVWRLARFRNTQNKVIPEQVITKPPSAELRPRQTDQDSLPPYEVLDRILRDYIEEDRDREDITARLRVQKASLGSVKDLPALVHEVIQRVDQNEYKRRQGAPTLRVSPKAWTGRRMPITNKFKPSL